LGPEAEPNGPNTYETQPNSDDHVKLAGPEHSASGAATSGSTRCPAAGAPRLSNEPAYVKFGASRGGISDNRMLATVEPKP
jgi:hypothetical protein